MEINISILELEEAIVLYAIYRAKHINVNIISFGTDMDSAITRTLHKIKSNAIEEDGQVLVSINGSTLLYIGHVSPREAQYVLHPSNAVVEASDTLSNRHDWVQTRAEAVQVLGRVHLIILAP